MAGEKAEATLGHPSDYLDFPWENPFIDNPERPYVGFARFHERHDHDKNIRIEGKPDIFRGGPCRVRRVRMVKGNQIKAFPIEILHGVNLFAGIHQEMDAARLGISYPVKDGSGSLFPAQDTAHFQRQAFTGVTYHLVDYRRFDFERFGTHGSQSTV
jgi:hypothetical protein